MAQDATGLLAELLEAEHAVWRALLSGDAAADAALLDDGFLGVYPSGFATKADHAGPLSQGPAIGAYSIGMERVMDLGSGLALLSYRALVLRTGAREHETMYVSSLWRRGPDGWRNLFSQDTPAEPAP